MTKPSTRSGLVALAVGLLLASAGLTQTIQISGRGVVPFSNSVAPKSNGSKGFAAASSSKPAERPKAVVKVSGTAAPGLRLTLDGAASVGEDLRFRWIQTQGKAVPIDDPDRSIAHFVVPANSGPLAFLLVVSGSHGSDTAQVMVPAQPSAAISQTTLPVADAGDDQIALIGRQVTLNGSRSEPRGQIGYRWVQTGGAAVRFKIEDGYVYSFVPTLPGVFRFALVVAAGSQISAADEVVVTVGAAARRIGSGDAGTSAGTPAETMVPTQEVARSSLASVQGGSEAAESLAKIFEDVAGRMDLYWTYADAFSEMSRRMESVLPETPAQRQNWMERLFHPLTGRLIEIMRGEGLDLRGPDGQNSPLTAAQKATLAEHFRLIAEGFRSLMVPK